MNSFCEREKDILEGYPDREANRAMIVIGVAGVFMMQLQREFAKKTRLGGKMARTKLLISKGVV
jgi:hypothetical protein